MSILPQTNISMTQDSDFQKCGEVMVAPKRNAFAMSCSRCSEFFTRLHAFIRHLHQEHMDEYQFQAKDAEVQVYAVEELVNRTMYESEETVLNYDERFKEVGKKQKLEANMSILNALGDCDISLNFVENLDETLADKQVGDEGETEKVICEEENDNKNCKVKTDKQNCDLSAKESLTVVKETLYLTEHGTAQDCAMDVNDTEDEDDLDMNSTLIKHIKMDLDMDTKEERQKCLEDGKESIESAAEKYKPNEQIERGNNTTMGPSEDTLNATLAEDTANIFGNYKSPKSTGLKRLLSGLLDSFDISLDNIEDGLVLNQAEENEEKIPKSQENRRILEEMAEDIEEMDDISLNASILKQCLADDDDINDMKENDSQVQPKSDMKQQTERSRLPYAQLKCMASLDMDESDWNDCLKTEDESHKENNVTNESNKNAVKTPKSCKKLETNLKTPTVSKTRSETLERNSLTERPKENKSIEDAIFEKSLKASMKLEQNAELSKFLTRKEGTAESQIPKGIPEGNKNNENYKNLPQAAQCCKDLEQAKNTHKTAKRIENNAESNSTKVNANHKKDSNCASSGQLDEKFKYRPGITKTNRAEQIVGKTSINISLGTEEVDTSSQREILCTPKSTKNISKANKTLKNQRTITPKVTKMPRTKIGLKEKKSVSPEKAKATEISYKNTPKEATSSPISDHSTPKSKQNFKKTESATPKTAKTTSTNPDKLTPKSAEISGKLTNVTPKSIRTPSMRKKPSANGGYEENKSERDFNSTPTSGRVIKEMTPKTGNTPVRPLSLVKTPMEGKNILHIDIPPTTKTTPERLQKAVVSPGKKNEESGSGMIPKIEKTPERPQKIVVSTEKTEQESDSEMTSKIRQEKTVVSSREKDKKSDIEMTPKSTKAQESLRKAAVSPSEEEKEVEADKFEEGLSEDQSSTRMYEENKETRCKSKKFLLESLLSKDLDDEEDLDTLINQLETSTYGDQPLDKSLYSLNVNQDEEEVSKSKECESTIDKDEILSTSNIQRKLPMNMELNASFNRLNVGQNAETAKNKKNEVPIDNIKSLYTSNIHREVSKDIDFHESLNGINISHVAAEDTIKMTEKKVRKDKNIDLETSNIRREVTMDRDLDDSLVGLNVTEKSENICTVKESDRPMIHDELVPLKEKEKSIATQASKGDNDSNFKETTENKENVETQQEEDEEDIDDFENILNKEIAKALEKALGEDNADLFTLLEEEVPDTINQETLHEDENEESPSLQSLNEIKTPKKLLTNTPRSQVPLGEDTSQKTSNDFAKDLELVLGEERTNMLNANGDKPARDTICRESTFQSKVEPKSTRRQNLDKTTASCKTSVKKSPKNNTSLGQIKTEAPFEETCFCKYSKTNRKARHIQGKPVKVLENVLREPNVLALRLTNKKQSNCTRQQKAATQLIKGSHQAILQQKQTQIYKSSNRLNTSAENEENSPAKSNSPPLPVFSPFKRMIERGIETFVRIGINTDRGEKTPMKLEELFSTQSPKTLEKTAGKNDSNSVQRSPRNKICTKSPSNLKLNVNKIISPNSTETSKNAKVSPPKKPRNEAHISPKAFIKPPHMTPQKTRNLEVKLQRYTPSTKNHLPVHATSLTDSSTKQQTSSTKSFHLSNAERENLANIFNLPSGITISKVSADNNLMMLDVTANRSNYCKQNFTEQSFEQQQLQQQIIGQQQSQLTNSLINSLPNSVIATKTEAPSISTRIRARQASIDVVPSSKTPKKGGLDYKSYAVTRSVRKKEVLQRMRTIKKQIFKSIEVNSLASAKLVKSPLVKKGFRSKIEIENVEVLPNIESQVLTPLVNSHNSSATEQDINQTTQKSSVMVDHDGKNEKHLPPEPPLSKPMEQPTPETMANAAASLSLKSYVGSNAKQLMISKISPKPLGGKHGRRPCKRRASTTAPDEACAAKKMLKSPEKENTTNETGLPEHLNLGKITLESTLSNSGNNIREEQMRMNDITPNQSAEDNLESKETATNTKQEEANDAKTNENVRNNPKTNIIDDLLEQMTNEDTPDVPENIENREMTAGEKIVEDYDEAKDLELLKKVGLQIINRADVEDFYTLEEVEEMRAKAKKFSDICKLFPRLWNFSKLPAEPALLKQIHSQVNLNLSENITWTDFKRLINLISVWHTNCYNSKLIEKKPLLESTNHYLVMFNCISKTAKRIFYCEFCEQRSNTEHKYYVHRIKHTGDSHPYHCKICKSGFSRANFLKSHISGCQNTKNVPQLVVQRTAATDYKGGAITNTVVRKVAKSNNSVHDQTKGKGRSCSIYKCAKCAKSFFSESEVKLHTRICNSNVKRQPKQCTPRPKSKVESNSSN